MPPSTRLEWFGEDCSHHPFRAHFQSLAPQANYCKGRNLALQLFQPVVQLHLRRKIMKKLQQFFAAVVLTLLLSASTFAGDGIIMPWVTPPPPPTPVATNNASATEGTITTWLASNDSTTEVALSLLQGVLALF
jgi:hypothetical protein